MMERGIGVAHGTLNRWVIEFSHLSPRKHINGNGKLPRRGGWTTARDGPFDSSSINRCNAASTSAASSSSMIGPVMLKNQITSQQ